MNHMPQLNRRAFVVGTAAAGAGLALGFDVPFGGPPVVRAAEGTPEVNAWVVIRPDDTVVIRIARSEMGQGTRTGLAQLAAEELECDWNKVTTEYPTPGQSAARTCWNVPQRQMLVMASSMSASVGLGFSLSRAVTAMIMPLWQ